MTTTSEVAVRDTGALAIRPDQTAFGEMQLAALRQLGIEEASEGDQAVFLHQCQRTGLDPFARQIYMIARREKVPGTRDDWRTKYTIQTGIDGLRVMRARAEQAAGVRGILSRPVYYDAEGAEHKVWCQRIPPVAVEMTYTVRDAAGETPYTSILRFAEYAQSNSDGNLTGQWRVKGVHMLEKCTEADVYRKAFPQDFSGIVLEDAMPPARDWENATDEELDAELERLQRRGRVTAAQARARRQQRVRSEVVQADPETSPPAQAEPPAPAASPPPSSQADAGGDLPPLPGEDEAAPPARDAPGSVTPDQLKKIWTVLGATYLFGDDEKDAARGVCAQVAGRELASSKDMSSREASRVLDTLALWEKQAADAGEEPRGYLMVMLEELKKGEAGE